MSESINKKITTINTPHSEHHRHSVVETKKCGKMFLFKVSRVNLNSSTSLFGVRNLNGGAHMPLQLFCFWCLQYHLHGRDF